MMARQEQNIPALRFPEFDGVWQETSLCKVAKFSKGKGISKNDIDPGGNTYCVRYGEIYTHYDTIIDEPISKTSVPERHLVLSEGNEVIVPASGEDSKDIATAAVVLRRGVALGGDLNIIESDIDGAFLASYLSGKKRLSLAAMAQGNSVVHLYAAQLGALRLHLPTEKEEQQKIAGFLGAVDEKIAQLKKKKDLLEEYKKGCLQKLFSQAIRFTDDTGNLFPDWEARKIGDVAPLQRGFDLPTNDVVEGNFPVVYSNGILRMHNQFQAKGPGVVTGRSGTIGKVTYVENNYWPHNTSLWVTDFKGNIPKYIYYMYCQIRLEKYNAGSTVPTLNRNDVHIQKTYIPDPKEQKKIADFLSAIDDKIALMSKELDNAKTFKKGLLQQMFV